MKKLQLSLLATVATFGLVACGANNGNSTPEPTRDTVDVFVLSVDILFLSIISIIVYIFGLTGKKITRVEGISMLICYFLYVIFMLVREGIIIL